MKYLFCLRYCIAIAGMFIAGCSKDDDAPAKEISLSTSATLGSYLTDKSGRTLYFFANDAAGRNTCTGGCQSLWPALFLDTITADQLGSGLSISDFTFIATGSGRKQAAYKSWPLYTYSPVVNGVNTPEAPASTSGEGVGNVWFIAKPDYSIMFSNAQLLGQNGKNYKSDYTEGEGRTIYFTDGKGLTLYAFRNDRNLKNNFTRPDFTNNSVWPIYETDKVSVPSTLDKTAFVAIDVAGRKQLTYKGWPLYYFGQDAGVRGSNKGISFPSPGVWPILFKDIAPAPPL